MFVDLFKNMLLLLKCTCRHQNMGVHEPKHAHTHKYNLTERRTTHKITQFRMTLNIEPILTEKLT